MSDQLERYPDLPRDVEQLDRWTRRKPGAADESGKFTWREDEIVFTFGKHLGRPLREVADEARGYLEWIINSDFPDDSKELVRLALDGDLPLKPTENQSA